MTFSKQIIKFLYKNCWLLIGFSLVHTICILAVFFVRQYVSSPILLLCASLASVFILIVCDCACLQYVVLRSPCFRPKMKLLIRCVKGLFQQYIDKTAYFGFLGKWSIVWVGGVMVIISYFSSGFHLRRWTWVLVLSVGAICRSAFVKTMFFKEIAGTWQRYATSIVLSVFYPLMFIIAQTISEAPFNGISIVLIVLLLLLFIIGEVTSVKYWKMLSDV